MSDTTDTPTSNKRFAVPIHVKYAANKPGEFDAYGSTFGGTPDAYGDIIAPGAFTKTIADHRAKGTSPALLWSHDMAQPIGVITQLSQDTTGLLVSGKLTLEVAKAAEAHALALAGALAMSIGYRATSATPMTRAGRTLNEITLYECSLVAVPANTNAKILSIKSRPDLVDLNNPRVAEKILRDAGYGREQSKLIVALAKKAFKPRDVAITEQILARKLIAAAVAINKSFQ